MEKCDAKAHHPRLTAVDFYKYTGPSLLVTVDFIDPGNWENRKS